MTPATRALIAKAEGRLPPDPDAVPESMELVRERLARSRRGLEKICADLAQLRADFRAR